MVLLFYECALSPPMRHHAWSVLIPSHRPGWQNLVSRVWVSIQFETIPCWVVGLVLSRGRPPEVLLNPCAFSNLLSPELLGCNVSCFRPTQLCLS